MDPCREVSRRGKKNNAIAKMVGTWGGRMQLYLANVCLTIVQKMAEEIDGGGRRQ